MGGSPSPKVFKRRVYGVLRDRLSGAFSNVRFPVGLDCNLQPKLFCDFFGFVIMAEYLKHRFQQNFGTGILTVVNPL